MRQSIDAFLDEVAQIAATIDRRQVINFVGWLEQIKAREGRLFILGIGGSAAASIHAASDLRRLAGIDARAAAENVAELTARANDDGLSEIFSGWLITSKLSSRDGVLVLSVGGGSLRPNVSRSLVLALRCARTVQATILGIVGRDGGFTARTADACVLIPTIASDRVTLHTESFQSVLLHMILDPQILGIESPRWEKIERLNKRHD